MAKFAATAVTTKITQSFATSLFWLRLYALAEPVY